MSEHNEEVSEDEAGNRAEPKADLKNCVQPKDESQVEYRVYWPGGSPTTRGRIVDYTQEKLKEMFPEADITKLFENFNLSNMMFITKDGRTILIVKTGCVPYEGRE